MPYVRCDPATEGLNPLLSVSDVAGEASSAENVSKMFVIRFLVTLVPALGIFVAGMSVASANAATRRRCAIPLRPKAPRARADELYGRAHYYDAGTAYAAAARFTQGCATPDSALDTATSVARAGGAFGQGGNIDLGLTQLRRAQALIISIIARFPHAAPDAREYLAAVTTTINSIDSQFM